MVHGLASYINPNLDYFKNIVPCGIEDKAITSMEKELNKIVSIKEVSEVLKKYLYALFEMND